MVVDNQNGMIDVRYADIANLQNNICIYII